MARDSSGNFDLPVHVYPVVDGTTIEAPWANALMDEISAALQDSLSRTGLGGLLTPLSITDGDISNPALRFTSSPNTGFYRGSDGYFYFVTGGVRSLRLSGESVQIWDATRGQWVDMQRGQAEGTTVTTSADPTPPADNIGRLNDIHLVLGQPDPNFDPVTRIAASDDYTPTVTTVGALGDLPLLLGVNPTDFNPVSASTAIQSAITSTVNNAVAAAVAALPVIRYASFRLFGHTEPPVLIDAPNADWVVTRESQPDNRGRYRITHREGKVLYPVVTGTNPSEDRTCFVTTATDTYFLIEARNYSGSHCNTDANILVML